VKNLKTGIMWNKHTHEDGTLFTKEEFLQKLKTDKEFNNEFGNKGIDQISELIRLLKETPDSRRMVVNAWAVHDLPNQVLPPCHYGFQVYTRELSLEERVEIYGVEKIQTNNAGWYECSLAELDVNQANIPKRAISLMYNARSQDVPLGTPFNISSYALLLTIIAKEVNMVPDELIANMGDCHIYLNQIEGVIEQIGREPYPLPKLLCLDEFHYLMDKELVGEIPFSEKIEKFRPDFFTLENYQSHPPIKMPLSN
jgi:thymidylate synthase